VDLRGPSLKAAQGHVNETSGETIGRVADRNAGAAAHEYGVYLGMERQAQSRQLAAEQAAAERDEELYQRQMDFDQSVKALSQASMDPDRFWSSRSTGQKVAGMVGVALGGFLQGARGGPNPALEMINTAIERDIKAQEFGYMAARDTASQKQTAFAMAMQKFNSVDAARSLARAAALDAVQAQLGQAKAVYAGTEAANRADMAMAQIEVDKMNQIAQGVRFIPQQTVGGARRFLDRRFGTVLTEAQMIARGDKIEDREHDIGKIGVQGGVDLSKGVALERAKAEAERGKKASDEARAISSQIQQAGVPQARASAERALKALNISEGGKAEAIARWGLGETLSKAVMSQDANAREQAYNDFMSAAMKATYGNVTASEEVRSARSYGATGDPAARRRSIDAVLDTLESIEKNAKAGASPEAQEEFDRRRQAAQGGPAAAPKDATNGWGQ
jgi:hypothetical protein